MKTLLYIPIASIIPYLLYFYWRYGMTESISDTYRFTQKFEKVWFTITMFLVAIPIMIVGFDVSNQKHTLILWLMAGGLICLVGVAPVFWKGGMEFTAHMIGAVGGIISGMLALLLYCFSEFTVTMVGLFTVFTATQLFAKLRLRNHIYWIEVAAIVTVLLSLWFV